MRMVMVKTWLVQAKAGSLMSGMVGRHQASDEPAAEDMEDGNPFAFHPPAEMMRTLPSLQASFTSAGATAC